MLRKIENISLNMQSFPQTNNISIEEVLKLMAIVSSFHPQSFLKRHKEVEGTHGGEGLGNYHLKMKAEITKVSHGFWIFCLFFQTSQREGVLLMGKDSLGM